MRTRIPWRYIVVALLAATIASFATFVIVRTQQTQSSQNAKVSTAAAGSHVTSVNGMTVVNVDAEGQNASGIEVAALKVAMHQIETVAYGTVMDLQPLVDLRARYSAARADIEAARASVDAASAEYKRLRTLYEDNQNASLKAYQAAQATYLSDQARKAAAMHAVEDVRASLRQQFGEVIERWLLQDASLLRRLARREEILVRITLPAGNTAAPSVMEISAPDNRRFRADLVSRSPQSDPAIQGNAYIYRSAAPIAAKTNIVAHLPSTARAIRGTAIPASAIVWYGGRPWVYVQIAPQQFARRPVPEQFPSDGGGLFVTEGVHAGERVVVNGAQLLLSEELRPPPNSSNCSDPECD